MQRLGLAIPDPPVFNSLIEEDKPQTGHKRKSSKEMPQSKRVATVTVKVEDSK